MSGVVLACGVCMFWLWLGAMPCQAGGDVYAHVDSVSGMVVLNNVPAVARVAPDQALAAQKSVQATVTAFARLSPARQRAIDADRRAILQDELDEERRALAAAYAKRAEGDVLARHAANVAGLQRELARLTSK